MWQRVCLALLLVNAAPLLLASKLQLRQNLTEPGVGKTLNYSCGCDGSSSIKLGNADTYILSTAHNCSDVTLSSINCTIDILPADDSRQADAYYHGEILSAGVPEDKTFLQVLDGSDRRRLIFESNLDPTSRVFVTRTDIVRVIFTAVKYSPGSSGSGYRIRLKRRIYQCPIGWSMHVRHCFSNQSSTFLASDNEVAMPKADVATAQSVCNRMRSNLFVASPAVLRDIGVYGGLGELVRKLDLTEPVWIGLMVKAGHSELTWIDGAPFIATESDWVTCRSGYNPASPGVCQPSERFAYLRPTTAGFLVLDRPESRHHFICYSALGGVNTFFNISGDATPSATSIPYILVFLAIFVAFIVNVVISIVTFRYLRSNRDSGRYLRSNRDSGVRSVSAEAKPGILDYGQRPPYQDVPTGPESRHLCPESRPSGRESRSSSHDQATPVSGSNQPGVFCAHDDRTQAEVDPASGFNPAADKSILL